MTLDTTRADHTSIYQYEKDTTPNLLKISKEGILFENVYSPVPLTLPSHISLFTGESPFEHKIFLNGQFFKPKKNYLPFLFKEKNYKNYAFLSSSILDRVFGISEGFDFYEDNFSTERTCEETLKIFKEKLKQISQPFFLWIHFFDPHSPYNPPENFKNNFQNPYDGEIAYMDFCIGELFKILPENTISLIVADHGELLGEHGEEEHGVLLYEGAIKVPCLLINSEIKNEKFSKQISFDTIYKIIYSYFFEGKSFEEILNKIEEKPIITSSLYGREVFGFEPSRAIIHQGFKLILYGESSLKLFDLKEDKEEKMDISKEKIEKTKELIKILKKQIFPDELTNFVEGSDKLLKSLGYLTPSKSNNLKDPEKGVLTEKKIKEAMEKVSLNDYSKAIEILKDILKEFPRHGEALSLLGKLYLSIGEEKKGLEVFEKLFYLRKNDVITNLRYAQALIANGVIEKAESILENCLKVHPRLKEGYGELSKIYSLKNEKEKILNLQKKAEENEIEEPTLLFEVGKIMEAEKKYEESFIFYHKSYRLNPLNLEALFALGRVSFKKGNQKLSIFYYKQILKIYPNNFLANFYCGLLIYSVENKKDEAIIYLKKSLNLCKKDEICNKINEILYKIEKNEKLNLEEII